METKKFIQHGTLSIVVILPVILFIIGMMFLTGFDNTAPLIIQAFVLAVLLVCLLIFRKLTIVIDDSYFSFRFGTSLFGKKYPISEIESCRPVRNPLWYGVGIRITPEGWLYNVSGQYAVELTFKNKKTKVRIGTDKPEEVSKAVNDILGRRRHSAAPEPAGRSGVLLFLVFLTLTLSFPFILILYGNRETELICTENQVNIGGMYSMAIKYGDITLIDTVSTFPKIKTRTNGFATGKALKGDFKLHDDSKVKLHIMRNCPPYIHIKTAGTELFLNFSESDTTIYYYEKIKSMVNSDR